MVLEPKPLPPQMMRSSLLVSCARRRAQRQATESSAKTGDLPRAFRPALRFGRGTPQRGVPTTKKFVKDIIPQKLGNPKQKQKES
jgi:hypothetical protein